MLTSPRLISLGAVAAAPSSTADPEPADNSETETTTVN